jgi:3-methyladenine DNA glycosylase AlkD
MLLQPNKLDNFLNKNNLFIDLQKHLSDKTMNELEVYKALKDTLTHHASELILISNKKFFKTKSGQYAEHDSFLGISMPNLRKIAKNYSFLSFELLETLLKSALNEERLLALLILIQQYQKADTSIQEKIYEFYLKNLQYVNNWNLVDCSAYLIIGNHLMYRDRSILVELTKSETVWQRRIAIVSTWYFIRNNDLSWTFKIAELLLKDKHDLIHKSVGWMLREAGKRDQTKLIEFLEKKATTMPRTMLRYAIEKLPEYQRKKYLAK